mmetsp:Transcript_13952/g.27120  ORF Transcript_13952/g.27120 Transcript_13952/m.27120 type:complete len:110 (+) Transcript_13952:372-701(+)
MRPNTHAAAGSLAPARGRRAEASVDRAAAAVLSFFLSFFLSHIDEGIKLARLDVPYVPASRFETQHRLDDRRRANEAAAAGRSETGAARANRADEKAASGNSLEVTSDF